VEETSGERFLRWLNEQNAIVAKQAHDAQTQIPKVDEIREQRQEERREKLGQLRARTHSGSRPKHSKNVFGYIDVS
jgi:hypothetical protein